MILTPLGHTEFLIDITNTEGENIRILVDSWLSDFVVGDLMERSVKVRFDTEKLASLDAIYISHAHTDHFDPYTLSLIYQHASPLLILPFTLKYLEPLLLEFLPAISIHWLRNRETLTLRGIEITGYMFENPTITNEDDVMMIAVSNDHELLFAEIDTLPDEFDEAVQKSLYKIFTRRDYQTACYIASRNHLEGQIPLYDTAPKKRRGYRDQYIGEQKEGMEMSYEKYDYEEYAHFPNLYTLPGFVRGYIGQGLQYPSSLSASLSKMILFPLEEVASLESDLAKNHGYEFPQKALLPGRQYRVEGGNIETGRKECPIGSLEFVREHIDIEDAEERIYATGPLFPRAFSTLDLQEAKRAILEILNSRFLPYWSASSVASLRSALIQNPEGVFRIELKVTHEEKIIFEYSPTISQFREVPYAEKMYIDEDYWLADILDFLRGRQELYSSFWHRLDPKKIYRLWVCLGATWMNHDLVEQKYRLHFERAKKGETGENFVGNILNNL